jgi:hypothetical protein
MRCVALGWLSDDAFVFVKSLQAVYLYTIVANKKVALSALGEQR